MPIPTAAQLARMAAQQKSAQAAEAAAFKVAATKAKPQMRATLTKLAGKQISANPSSGYTLLANLYDPNDDFQSGPGAVKAYSKSEAFAKAWEEVIAAFVKAQEPRGYTVRLLNLQGTQYVSGSSKISVRIEWKKP